MSLKFEKLCSELLLEHFGSTVQKIHDELQWGPRTLNIIITNTALPPANVKKGLCVMIQYGFVKFEPGKVPHIAEYTLLTEKVILLLRYPRYLVLTEKKFGTVSKLLVEEALKRGNISASKAIFNVWQKAKDGGVPKYTDGVDGIKQRFNQLISNQFLMRYPSPNIISSDKVPQLLVKESELFQPPEIPLKELLNYTSQQTSQEPGDGNIYWRVNFDRFHQDMRDDLMVLAIERRIDPETGSVMRAILNLMYLRTEAWATQSNPVPFLEIKEAVEKLGNDYVVQYLDHYIRLIEEDSSNFVRKQGDGNTSSVYVNLVSAIRSLAEVAIENLVEYRFGCKAARIFRLVNIKKYIDQEQLQKLAMIPDKEAKQITYRLLQENFLHMQEIKKSISAGPAKNFYLLHVNINQVVNIVLEICYKAVQNTLTRAEHERTENMRLIEKHDKLSSIAQCMREQGTDEAQIKELVDEWMSPPERAQLEAIEKMIENLHQAELSIDETIFILQLYIYFESASLRKKS